VTARLSPGEEALWLLQRLVPDRGITNVAVSLRAEDPPRWWPLRESLLWLTARHPALRSAFPARGGAPTRVVLPVGDVSADLDLADLTEQDLPLRLREYAARPFDLERPPLLRLGLFRLPPERRHYRIVLAAHHLVVDAASLRLLLDELSVAYRSFADSGEPPDLPAPAPVPVAATPRSDSLDYWRARLAGFDPASTRLDPARAAGGQPTFAGEETERAFPAGFAGKVAALRSRGRSTDAAVLLAAYLLALRSQGAGDDALAGVMVSNRGGPHAASVGYHVATLPLRVTIDPGAPFGQLAGQVAAAMFDAVEHADTPFEMMAAEMAPVSDDPLWWRSGFIRHAYNFRVLPLEDGERVPRDLCTGLSRFDLELTVERRGGDFAVTLVYSTEMYSARFAGALLERIGCVVDQAHADPAQPVGGYDLRTAEEIAVLCAVNDTARRWPGPDTVPGLVAQVWSAAPDSVAVVDGARQVQYGELRDHAAAVTGLLRSRGVRAGDVVALAGRRGVGLAAAVLGTWLAGAAFLPLDPEHPAERVAGQLDDAGCRVVLDGQLLPPECRAGRTCLPVPGPGAAAAAPESAAVRPGDLAYLIYTSGTTGRPKGVELSHANLSNVVRHFAGLADAGQQTAMLWLTTFAFDISVLELCLPLVAGGRVVIADDAVRVEPERLLDLVERTGVTVMQATPTTWRMVAPVAGDRLAGRIALCGGEPLPPSLASALTAAGCRAFNVYGPTETTIWSTVADLAGEDPRRLTVGWPLANTRVYVLGESGQPRSCGVVGELCIAGAGVARGYRGQPEFTADRFRDDQALGRYYRTGDLARMLPDGRVELLGRGDRQVKLRGHRIELAEVEYVLEEHPRVRAACVVLRGDPSADGYLDAYVAADDRPGLVTDVWAHAKARLPVYALPSGIHRVDRLPQTPNGKVDVQALDKLSRDTAPSEHETVPRTEPGHGNGYEPDLVRAWRQVLARPSLDRHANFFLNGGTSLLAIRLAQAVTDECRVPVTMGMVFRAPSPAALAELLAVGQSARPE
jgi:amino acid adenylation domain-containing protein